MLKEIPLLRAPENKRTGIEMSPKVKCPDQTEAAIVPLAHQGINSFPIWTAIRLNYQELGV
jgi:hypothetical protein